MSPTPCALARTAELASWAWRVIGSLATQSPSDCTSAHSGVGLTVRDRDDADTVTGRVVPRVGPSLDDPGASLLLLMARRKGSGPVHIEPAERAEPAERGNARNSGGHTTDQNGQTLAAPIGDARSIPSPSRTAAKDPNPWPEARLTYFHHRRTARCLAWTLASLGSTPASRPCSVTRHSCTALHQPLAYLYTQLALTTLSLLHSLALLHSCFSTCSSSTLRLSSNFSPVQPVPPLHHRPSPPVTAPPRSLDV